ncbi:MAG: hypothetical protein GKR87_01190 [Kiritimatiellae bacterium]|nr:hypothetical protein [Kiritimatiellia bacterium]
MAYIADHIAKDPDAKKWILMAGPSSSGKTTFAKRLAIQLRVNGFQPVTISVDNYFVDREKSPRNENGNIDFEAIENIDLQLLNEHVCQLDQRKTVDLPHFNFETGKREYNGRTLQVAKDQLVMMEGIHCLNPRLMPDLPAKHTYKIYISALTQLNLDFYNRIPTTDNRLIRQLVRDHQFRGYSALDTLKM